ncbi:MAG: MinD/ParA family protein [Myxococcota bacterium]
MNDTTGGHAGRRPLRVLAVTSGKGGVGKTHLTVNLALAFANQGRRVLILDGDLGLANVDILLDEAPRYTLRDVLTGRRTIDEALVPSPHGVTVLPGTSGVTEMAALADGERLRVLEAVEGLDERFDTVLVDTPAGIGANAQFFAGAAQEVLVVATPEPTSLADAYAMVKVLSRRCGIDRVGVVLNQVTNEMEGREIFERLSVLTSRFLPVVLELVGQVPRDAHVREAAMSQAPLLTAYPSAPASQAITALADAVLMRPVPTQASGRMQLFWRRLLDGVATSGDAPAPRHA